MGHMLSTFEALVSPSIDKKTEGTRQIILSSGIFCMSSIQALHKHWVLQHYGCTGQVARSLVLFMKLQGFTSSV